MPEGLRRENDMRRWIGFYVSIVLGVNQIVSTPAFCKNNASGHLLQGNWDDTEGWYTAADDQCTARLSGFNGINGDGLKIEYSSSKQGGWVVIGRAVPEDFPMGNPIVFRIRSNGVENLELKFCDNDSTTYGRIQKMKGRFEEWKQVVVYFRNAHFWWKGVDHFDRFRNFEIAVSSIHSRSDSVFIDEIGIGDDSLNSSFEPFGDPDSTRTGYEFESRRSETVISEDPLVLEYLKEMQDHSSADRKVLPNLWGDVLVSTFNNSLVSMVFVLKREKERAERILDFYRSAMDRNNQDIARQSFYYNGEARGFYQQMKITDYTRGSDTEDRWIGDMAWMALAFQYYDQVYDSDRYSEAVNAILDLFRSYYMPSGSGGYIGHGWRKGDDHLHEGHGHPEGNIDCYAAFAVHDTTDPIAAGIRSWLEDNLDGRDLPFDLYSWRVMAFGSGYGDLLNIPEYDSRFRKKISVGSNILYGFYNEPDIFIDNIWTEAIGHMSIGQMHYGDRERGYFYANQMDPMIQSNQIDDKTIHVLSYSASSTGEYDWIFPDRGYVSPAAWYILAKNGFNPLALKQILPPVDAVPLNGRGPENLDLYQNYPNPFNNSTVIHYSTTRPSPITLKIYTLTGETVVTLVNGSINAGYHVTCWDGKDDFDQMTPSGVYVARIKTQDRIKSIKILHVQ
jgi:hypothetical protein